MDRRWLGFRGRVTRRPGLGMIEVTIAVAVVGVMLVAALETVRAARVTEHVTSQRSQGLLLARDLMSEILQQPFHDPAGSPTTSIGPSSSELSTGNRSQYDDVDDYDGWEASPPELKDGTPIAWATKFTRSVAVDWVNPLYPDNTASAGSGVKRVIVTVEYDKRQVASLLGYRTSSWVDPVECQGGGG